MHHKKINADGQIQRIRIILKCNTETPTKSGMWSNDLEFRSHRYQSFRFSWWNSTRMDHRVVLPVPSMQNTD